MTQYNFKKITYAVIFMTSYNYVTEKHVIKRSHKNFSFSNPSLNWCVFNT